MSGIHFYLMKEIVVTVEHSLAAGIVCLTPAVRVKISGHKHTFNSHGDRRCKQVHQTPTPKIMSPG